MVRSALAKVAVATMAVSLVACGLPPWLTGAAPAGSCVARPDAPAERGTIYLSARSAGIVAIGDDGVASLIPGSGAVMSDPEGAFLASDSGERLVHGLDGQYYAHTFAGVARLTPTSIEVVAPIGERRLGEFAVAADGTIWASTWGGGPEHQFERWDGQRWSAAVDAGSSGPAAASDVAIDGSGAVWAIDAAGLWLRRGEAWERVDGPEVEDLVNSGDGRAFGWSRSVLYALDAAGAGAQRLHDDLHLPFPAPAVRTSTQGTTVYTSAGSVGPWATRGGTRCDLAPRPSIDAVDDVGRTYAIDQSTLIVTDFSGQVVSRLELEGIDLGGARLYGFDRVGVTGTGPRLPQPTLTAQQWQEQREAARQAKIAKAGDPDHLVMGKLQIFSYQERRLPADPSEAVLRERHQANLAEIKACIAEDDALLSAHRGTEHGLEGRVRVIRGYWPLGSDDEVALVSHTTYRTETSKLGPCIATALGLRLAAGLTEEQMDQVSSELFQWMDVNFYFE